MVTGVRRPAVIVTVTAVRRPAVIVAIKAAVAAVRRPTVPRAISVERRVTVRRPGIPPTVRGVEPADASLERAIASLGSHRPPGAWRSVLPAPRSGRPIWAVAAGRPWRPGAARPIVGRAALPRPVIP